MQCVVGVGGGECGEVWECGGGGECGVHVQGANQWYELQDLHVQDLLPQMITLAEAYIQVKWSCDIHVRSCDL